MIYLVCPKCGRHITNLEWKSNKYDYKCPKCKSDVLSNIKGGKK